MYGRIAESTLMIEHRHDDGIADGDPVSPATEIQAVMTVLARRTVEYDKATLKQLEVPREQWRRALDQLEPTARGAMERAARHVKE